MLLNQPLAFNDAASLRPEVTPLKIENWHKITADLIAGKQ